jgi:hypothetical protein
MIVVLLRDYQQLRQGAEGIIYNAVDGAWLAVFGCTCIRLPFDGQGIIYRLV